MSYSAGGWRYCTLSGSLNKPDGWLSVHTRVQDLIQRWHEASRENTSCQRLFQNKSLVYEIKEGLWFSVSSLRSEETVQTVSPGSWADEDQVEFRWMTVRWCAAHSSSLFIITLHYSSSSLFITLISDQLKSHNMVMIAEVYEWLQFCNQINSEGVSDGGLIGWIELWC